MHMLRIVLLLLLLHSITAKAQIVGNTIQASATLICVGSGCLISGSLPTGCGGVYDYQWESSSDGSAWTNITQATLQDYSELSINTNQYYRRRVDAPSCTQDISSSLYIQAVPILGNNLIGSHQTLCAIQIPGQLTGSLPSGGDGVYQYDWQSSSDQITFQSTGHPSQAFQPGIISGTTWYRRIVFSVCADTTSVVEVMLPSNPLFVQEYIQAPQCQDGLIQLTASGGGGGYQYSWTHTPSLTSQTASGLNQGTYNWTVIDQAGCSYTNGTILIHQNAYTVQVSKDSSWCQNGYITLNPLGGTPPYSYDWTGYPSLNQASLTSLSSGTYYCEIRDINGCLSLIEEVISTGSNINQSTTTTFPDSCNPYSSIAVHIAGGKPPYTYSWNTYPAQTTSIGTGFSAGTYSCLISDQSGCSHTVYGTPGFVYPMFDSLVVLPATCFMNNGKVLDGGFSGNPPLTFQWDNGPIVNSVERFHMPIGTYTLNWWNGSGCHRQRQVSITGIQGMSINGYRTNPTCFGGYSNGSANLSSGDFYLPVSYLWSTGQTTQSISGLTQGSYTIIVTDSTGCIDSMSFTLINQNGVSGSISEVPLPSPNQCTTIYTLQGNSGTPPFQYLWSSGQTTQTIQAPSGAIVSAILSDFYNCQDTVEYTSTNGLPLSSINNNSLCGGSNGYVYINLSSGTQPYHFQWSLSPPPSGNSAFHLPPGTHSVTVTDALGCQANLEFPIPVTCNHFKIEGNLWIDMNGNGILDLNEPSVNSMPVRIIGSFPNYLTNAQGHYSTQFIPWGTYNLYVDSIPGFNPPHTILSPVSISSNTIQVLQENFGYTIGSPYYDMALSGLNNGSIRVGNSFQTILKVRNYSNMPSNPEIITLHYPADISVDTVYAAGYQNNTIQRTLTIPVPGNIPICGSLDIVVVFQVSTNATLFSLDTIDFTLNPVSNDQKPSNNSSNFIFRYNGPYDPNDNMLIPDGHYGYIHDLDLSDSIFTYRIRFQNTGNDTAFTVIVVDTLDTDLIPESFEFIAASSDVQVSLDSARELRFVFPDIKLPDSTTNEAASHGWIYFRIKGNPQVNHVVYNTAHIYFDYNPPITTNTSQYTWKLTTNATNKLMESVVHLYPNPTDNILYIETPEWFGIYTYTLYSTDGRILQQGNSLNQRSYSLETHMFSRGVCFLKIEQGEQYIIKPIILN